MAQDTTEVAADADLPRAQSGPNPQHLAVTLIGHYWGGYDTRIPTAALVDVLGEFGITPPSARRAIARLVARGVLTSTRAGRNTFVRATAPVIARGIENRARILPFGSDEWMRSRSGEWTIVSLPPESRRTAAMAPLRRTLAERGFVALHDDMWASATSDADAAEAALRALPGVDAVVIRGRIVARLVQSGMSSVIDELHERYTDFLTRFRPLADATARGALDGAEALRIRTEAMNAWRSIVLRDPGLPPSALPPGWPLAEARRVLVTLYDGLGPPAEHHLRSLLRDYALEIPPTHHLTTSPLDE